jgi:hypothetical protein
MVEFNKYGHVNMKNILKVLIPIVYLFSQEKYSLKEFNHNIFKIDYETVRSYPVTDYDIEKSGLTIKIKNGTFTFIKGRNKEYQFVYFEGKATIEYQALSEMEKKHFKKFFDADKIDDSLEQFTMIFTDDFYKFFEESKSVENPRISKIENTFNSIFGDFNMYSFHKEFIDNSVNSSFIWLNTDDFGKLFFLEQTLPTEEISLLKTFSMIYDGLESINSYHKKEDYKHQFPDTILNRIPFNAISYNMDIHIKSNYEMDNVVDVTYISNYDNQKSMVLNLLYKLDIKKITDQENNELKVYQIEKRGQFLLELANKIMKDDTLKLKFYYEGEGTRRFYNYIVLWSSTDWYPNTGFRDKAKYFVKYTYPENHVLIAVGEKLLQLKKEDEFISVWKTKKAEQAYTFNIGLFNQYTIQKHEKVQKVTVYGRTDQSNMKNELAPELVNSLNFFNNIYGKTSYETLIATEIPFLHGQSFAGFLHLSSVAFLHDRNEGYIESFRAHEVAHQWWGHSVTEKTYHDAWLEEGFAEYSGMWYAQLTTNDSEKFHKFLRNYRDDIISNRTSPIFSDGVESSAIYMGRRAGGSETAGDYGLIIYKKGAYVLHMIRMMMMNMKNLSDDYFIAMMKDYFNTYKGKSASTEDFKRIVEKHGGMKMDWFFNQWVYNSEVPEFKYAWKYEKTDDGKYIVEIKLAQENVPENFQSIIPIAITFEGDKFYRTKLLFNTKQTILTLPPLPFEPEDLKFNIFESVLCEYDEEDWDDF